MTMLEQIDVASAALAKLREMVGHGPKVSPALLAKAQTAERLLVPAEDDEDDGPEPEEAPPEETCLNCKGRLVQRFVCENHKCAGRYMPGTPPTEASEEDTESIYAARLQAEEQRAEKAEAALHEVRQRGATFIFSARADEAEKALHAAREALTVAQLRGDMLEKRLKGKEVAGTIACSDCEGTFPKGSEGYDLHMKPGCPIAQLSVANGFLADEREHSDKLKARIAELEGSAKPAAKATEKMLAKCRWGACPWKDEAYPEKGPHDAWHRAHEHLEGALRCGNCGDPINFAIGPSTDHALGRCYLEGA